MACRHGLQIISAQIIADSLLGIMLETQKPKFYNLRRKQLKEKDNISHKYMSNPERFADVFNKEKKGNEWTMSSESIDILNNFAGTRISTKELKSEGGRVKMSRLTQDLIDEGLDKGIAGAIVILKKLGLDEKSIIQQITEQYKITEEKAKTFL